jgi:hypothetical protein
MNFNNPNNTPTGSRPSPMRSLLIIGLIVVAAIIFLPRLFNTGNAPTTAPSDQNFNQPVNPPAQNNGNTSSSAQLGPVVAAAQVDRDNCPVNTSSTFSGNQSINVVAQNSSVAQGTTVFVRLYRDGQPVEDAPQITADQAYRNSCISFVFQPRSGTTFDAGNYEAQFIVNGNPGPSVQFQVR